MKNLLLISVTAALLASSTLAHAADIFTGPEGAQTVHNCHGVAMTERNYTTSPVMVRLVKAKLAQLGYATQPGDRITRHDTKTIKRFQKDYALPTDGVVNSRTALALAYETAPNRAVASCLRLAMQ